MAEESLIDITSDFSKLKVPDLKRELRLRGLSTTGNKTELVERLQKFIKNGTESVEDLDEDILEDDDDEHLDASESVILENDLEESPKSQKRKSEECLDELENKKPTKKVILNRNPVISPDIVKSSDDKANEEKIEQNGEEKKIIKLSQLNAKERLELRAKKFGVTSLPPDVKKAVRAERFGTTNNKSAESITSTKVNTTVDVLKQRAERFGTSVSSVMSNLENQEKLERRKARFGITSTTSCTSDDKAKARLERFKQTVA